MEKFTYTHTGKPRDFVEWAFLVAFTSMSDEDWRAIFHERENTGGSVDIELRINSKEASFTEILTRMKREQNRLVEERANELVGEKCSDLLAAIHDLTEAVGREAKARFGGENDGN